LKNAHVTLGGIAALLNQTSWGLEEELEERGIVIEPVYVKVQERDGSETFLQEGLFPLEKVNSILRMIKDITREECVLKAQYFTKNIFPGLILTEEEGGFILKYED